MDVVSIFIDIKKYGLNVKTAAHNFFLYSFISYLVQPCNSAQPSYHSHVCDLQFPFMCLLQCPCLCPVHQ